MRSLTIIVSLVVAIAACSQKMEAYVAPREQLEVFASSDLVPPFFKPSNLRADKVVPTAPLVDDQVVMQGLAAVHETLERGLLTHQDDEKIVALVREYKKGKPFPLRTGTMRFGADGKPQQTGQVAGMVYDCTNEVYVVYPGLRMSWIPFTATLYHEMRHEIECKDLLKAQGVYSGRELTRAKSFPSVCAAEGRGYAAQVRMLVALSNMRPKNSMLTMSKLDLNRLDETLDVWEALAGNKFCEYYRQRMATPRTQ